MMLTIIKHLKERLFLSIEGQYAGRIDKCSQSKAIKNHEIFAINFLASFTRLKFNFHV